MKIKRSRRVSVPLDRLVGMSPFPVALLRADGRYNICRTDAELVRTLGILRVGLGQTGLDLVFMDESELAKYEDRPANRGAERTERGAVS